MTDETKQLVEQVVQDRLRKDGEVNDDGTEAVDTRETVELIEQLNAARQMELDALDKEERRKIEREKNETLLAVEREKQKITIRRAALEIAKIILPAALSIGAYNVFQKRMFFFEKTNRVCSSTGRELRLPQFMK